jgi:hypothetical protein
MNDLAIWNTLAIGIPSVVVLAVGALIYGLRRYNRKHSSDA